MARPAPGLGRRGPACRPATALPRARSTRASRSAWWVWMLTKPTTMTCFAGCSDDHAVHDLRRAGMVIVPEVQDPSARDTPLRASRSVTTFSWAPKVTSRSKPRSWAATSANCRARALAVGAVVEDPDGQRVVGDVGREPLHRDDHRLPVVHREQVRPGHPLAPDRQLLDA